ncbi:Mitochondrial nuclease [Nakaseomyces bracarensis]|uniref:Endonuclease n=1 Tax=Nakaseomyces bracarensis TaxID=273131 RepID=A0ABR4NQR7_9SACH
MFARQVLTGVTGFAAGSGLVYLYLQKKKENTALVPSSSLQPLPIGLPKGVKASDFFKYGFPGPVHDLEDRGAFVSCYNRQTRNPYWVVEHMTPESLSTRAADRKNSIFTEDEVIPEMFRSKLADYFRSGYDRGHQVPAADVKFSQSAMDNTFYLTNISPQVGEGFNRDYWAHLEYFCRGLTKKYNSVRVVTGPLYLPKWDPAEKKYKVSYEVIGNPPNVAVPTHFFKLIIAEGPKNDSKNDNLAVATFVLPNERIPNETKLLDFEVPLNALERSSGLEFLKNVPTNKQRRLCEEVNCQIVVRDFSNANNRFKKDKPSLPTKK